MLENSDIAPIKIEVLEEIINLPKQSQKLKQNFSKFRIWLEILFKKLEKEELQDLIGKVTLASDRITKYYKYLQKCLDNPETLNGVATFSKVNGLKYSAEIICYFESLKDLFYFKSAGTKFKLKENIKQENITKIYKLFLDAYGKLFDVLYWIENTLYEINVEKWEKVTLHSKDIDCIIKGASTLDKEARIPGIQFVVASFSNDTSNSYNSGISLIRTDGKKEEGYGFLYDFSKETLYKDDLSTVSSNDWQNDKLSRLIQSLEIGNSFDTISYNYENAVWNLNPLYDLDEVIAKSGQYKINLKKTSYPFGILVWKENLKENLNEMQAFSTLLHLPILIIDNYEIKVIPWQNVFDEIE